MTRPHDNPTGDDARHDALAEATLYLSGAASPEDRRRFERRLADGDPQAVTALRDAEETLAALDRATPPDAEPPATLRDRVLSGVADQAASTPLPVASTTQVWRRWTADGDAELADGLSLRRADDGGWEPTSVAGVSVRQLAVDLEADTVTMLVRMAPGSSYPPHRHAGAEECLVLEGDLHVAGEVMTAGDFQRAETGSVHGVQSTERGCVLHITSSRRDELLVG